MLKSPSTPSATTWEELIAGIDRSLGDPESVVEGLEHGYDDAAIERGLSACSSMLLPEQPRPRISPASLRVQESAAGWGCFFASWSLRRDLVPPAVHDRRWQSGYLQHHPVIDGAGPADANVEAHDLVHAMLGLMWWDDIDPLHFYLASRLSEATAAYHYYFLDQVLEPRCEVHEGVVDLARIWKFNICPACNRSDNWYFRLPGRRRDIARYAAVDIVRKARLFYLAELRDIACQAQVGIGFVERNPVNLSSNAADAHRYAHYVRPFLSGERLQDYLGSLGNWQVSTCYELYLERAGDLLHLLQGGCPTTPSSVGSDLRRCHAVAQDLLLRIGMVLAQHDEGVREVAADEVARMEACQLQLVVALKDPDPVSLAGSIESICRGLDRPDPSSAVGLVLSVGYEPELAVGLVAAADVSSRLTGTADRDGIADTMIHVLESTLPRSTRYLRVCGVLGDVVEEFRRGPERWRSVDNVPGDGLVPQHDKFLQRFVTLLGRLADGSGPSAASAAVAEALARIEHAYARYQLRAKPDLDLRTPAIEDVSDSAVSVGRAPSTEVLFAAVDIANPWNDATDMAYIFSLSHKHVYMTKLPADVGRLVLRLDPRGAPLGRLRDELTRLGLSEGAADVMLRHGLSVGALAVAGSHGAP